MKKPGVLSIAMVSVIVLFNPASCHHEMSFEARNISKIITEMIRDSAANPLILEDLQDLLKKSSNNVNVVFRASRLIGSDRPEPEVIYKIAYEASRTSGNSELYLRLLDLTDPAVNGEILKLAKALRQTGSDDKQRELESAIRQLEDRRQNP